MTRIGAANGAPNHSAPDSLGADGAGATAEPGAAVGARATRSGGVPGDASADRPAVQTGGAVRRPPTDGQVFLKDLKHWEGEHRFMYVDTRGYVTTGIGHLLRNSTEALKLPWYHSGTGRPATHPEIQSAFDQLCQTWTDYRRDHPNAKGIPLDKCQKVSDLVLPEGEPTRLALDRLDREFLRHLRQLFPRFDGYPIPAQRALVDMAYNLGVGKLAQKFPAFVAACRDGDFSLAAAECERSSCRQERNDATRELLQEAAQLSASVRTITREVRL